MYIMGIDPSETGTTATFEPGQLGANSDGRIYMYVQIAVNDVVAGDLCIISDDTPGSVTARGANTTRSAPATGQGARCGVACASITADSYGWIQVFGASYTDLNVGSSCATYTTLNTTATLGLLDDDATAGAEVINGIVTVAAESSNFAEASINWPYVGATL